MKLASSIFIASLFAGTLFLADSTLSADILEKTYDAPNGLKVSVKTIAPYAQPADLQIVCVFRHKANGDTYLQAMKDLDDKLGGLLSSLRNRGEFIGELGETILLRPPEGRIAAKQLLVIGLGDEGALSPNTLSTVGRVAATEAIHLKARSISFAPTIRDQGNATIGVGESDKAVVENVLLTYDTNKRLQNLSRSISGRLMPDRNSTRRQRRKSLRRWKSPPERSRNGTQRLTRTLQVSNQEFTPTGPSAETTIRLPFSGTKFSRSIPKARATPIP
jgi:hypothetical protein